tara:strand:+ start:806 stop:976 length:171 start_codon:yes stop_codon:yes gene_type:complete
MNTPRQSDAYEFILLVIDESLFKPGDRLVELELVKNLDILVQPLEEFYRDLKLNLF